VHQCPEFGDAVGERLSLVEQHPGDVGMTGGPVACRLGGGEEVDVSAGPVHTVLAASARTRDSVASWLGLAQLRAAWVPERRDAQLSDDELADLVGGRLHEVLDQLVAAGYLSAVSDGGEGRRWRIPDLPRLQRVLDLHAAGIDVELSIAMAKLLRRRLARLADDLVEMLASELLRQYGDQVEAPVEAVEVLRTVAVETTGEALVEEITYALDRLRARQQNGS